MPVGFATGAFWKGLADYVKDEETRELKLSEGKGWHKGMEDREWDA